MRLTPWEEERLLIFTAAELARRHRASGLALNAPEAIALICDAMLEAARAGATYEEVEAAGARGGLAGRGHAGRPRADRRGPARGPAGRRHAARGRARPARATGEPPPTRWARRGRGWRTRPAPRRRCASRFDRADRPQRVAPRRSASRPTTRSIGSTPGSSSTATPRAGSASTSPAGATERWAPGETRTVRLVRFAAARRPARRATRMTRLSPAERLARYGPTTGDRVRLGDTDLWVRVAEDRQAPGDEPIWGYAKTLRPRIGPGPRRARRSSTSSSPARSSSTRSSASSRRTSGSRTAGSSASGGRATPAISDGIELPIGPHTAADHGLRPDRDARARSTATSTRSARPSLPAALSGGVTTLITAGFEEPPWAMERTLAGARRRGRSTSASRPARGRGRRRARGAARRRRVRLQDPRGLRRLPRAHRPRPALRRRARRDASRSTPTASTRRAELEDTVAAIAGRTVHAYHVEGTRRRPRARPARARARGEHHLLVDDADRAVRASTRRPSTSPMIVLNHGASFGVADGPRAGPRAGPPGDDGGRGSAPRARRDRHRQLRFAGHGPDDGDGPADRSSSPT